MFFLMKMSNEVLLVNLVKKSGGDTSANTFFYIHGENILLLI